MKQELTKQKTKLVGTLALAALFIFLALPLTSSQTLTYDTTKNNISSAYDANNRILNQTGSSTLIKFIYDIDKNNTLTNVSNGNTSVQYEYDDRNRIIKETRIIDGISFVKEIEYDSMDRATKVNDITFTYGEEGKINQVGSLVNQTYNENLQVLLREYENNLDTNFTYDEDNFRLVNILTGDIQDWNYDYDDAGNVLGIDDLLRDYHFLMKYDDLNRLIESRIVRDGEFDILNYDYNSIGNIMSVFNDGVLKDYSYVGDIAHAPSNITVVENDTLFRALDYFNDFNNENFSANWGESRNVTLVYESMLDNVLNVSVEVWEDDSWQSNNHMMPSDYFVLIEADGLGDAVLNQNGCNVDYLGGGIWKMYASTGDYEVDRARIIKTLFYGSDGSDPQVIEIDGLTTLQSLDYRDIGRRVYYLSSDSGPDCQTNEGGWYGDFVSTSTNGIVSSWSYLYGEGYGMSLSDEIGNNTVGDEVENPSSYDLEIYGWSPSGYGNWKIDSQVKNSISGSNYASDNCRAKVMIMSKSAITKNDKGRHVSVSRDFFSDYDIPLFEESNFLFVGELNSTLTYRFKECNTSFCVNSEAYNYLNYFAKENKELEDVVFGDVDKMGDSNDYYYSFDGTGDYMELKDNVLDYAKSFSISFQANLENDSQGVLLGKPQSFMVGYNDGKFYLDFYNESDWIRGISSSNDLTFNQEQNVTITYNYLADELSLYLNSVLDARVTLNDKIGNSNENVYVGYFPELNNSEYVKGIIDDVMMWGRTLENIEVWGYNYSRILVESPNGGEEFNMTDPVLIDWSLVDPLPEMFPKFNLQYSNNNGTSWNNIASNWGFVDSINDSSTSTNLEFGGNENKTIYLRIPKNATVLNAKLDLIGGGL